MKKIVKRKREEMGISQNQLAKMSKVPQSVISNIENGKTVSPRIDTLKAIADVLGCSLDDLFDDEKKVG